VGGEGYFKESAMEKKEERLPTALSKSEWQKKIFHD